MLLPVQCRIRIIMEKWVEVAIAVDFPGPEADAFIEDVSIITDTMIVEMTIGMTINGDTARGNILF